MGKTSLAQCTAHALGRGFVKLACGGLHDETDLRGHNRTWRDAQPGSILREMRRVGSSDPVFVLDEIDKLGPAPAAVLLEVLDPEQNHSFRDAFIELPFDLGAVLFITTANEVARIPLALRDWLEIIGLPGYTEAEKIAIAETHLIPAQNRAAGLTATPVRFTRGACRRMIRDYTSERGIRQLTRCLQTVCRKVALGLETGNALLVCERITATQVRAFLGAPAVNPTDGLDRLREQVDAPGMPDVVRERGREVLERLDAWPRTDPEHAKQREYLRRLASLPWTKRTAAPLDLARARTVLDAGHAGHGGVKERLVDYIAVRLTKLDATAPLLCLVGPTGVGKTSLARLLAAALGRARAWVACAELNGPAAVHGIPSGPPGRLIEELRRVGVRNPMFVLDEVDRLDEGNGTAAALLEAIAPVPGAAFRDRYVDLPFDLAEALFVATANSLGSVPAVLRETMSVIELPGYTDADKRVIAKEHLLPWQLACHGLTADQVRVTDEAIEAMIRGYSRNAGVWDLADELATVCAKVVLRRAEGDEAPVEVAPEILPGLLGPLSHRKAEVAARSGRHGRRPGAVAYHGGRRQHPVRRSQPHARHRGADPDRRARRGDAGVGAGGAVVGAGQRGALRHRPGLPSRRRHPCARAVARGAQGRGLGRRHDGGRDGVRADGSRGPRRPGYDRRDHPRRAGPARRRQKGEGTGRAPLRTGPRHPPVAEPEACRRGARRPPPVCSHHRVRDADPRAAGLGVAARGCGGRGGGGHAGRTGVLRISGPAARDTEVSAGRGRPDRRAWDRALLAARRPSPDGW